MSEFIVVLCALAFGSFANVFVERFPKGKSLAWPPSSCPHCGHLIRWRHNIPVLGWLVLGGKCFDCRRPIALRYPLMEAAFGVLAGFTVLKLGVNPLSLYYLAFFMGLLLVAWVDWETMYIYDALTAPMALLGLSTSWFFPARFASPYDSAVAAVSMAALTLLLGELGRLYYGKEALGGGDVKLMAAGAGFLGCRDAWKALLLGALLALPLVLIYMRLKQLGRKDPAPFGPGLALGLAVIAWNIVGDGALDGVFERVGLTMLKAH